MVDQLRDAIRGSGLTLNEIMRLSGVDAGRLSRFMRGERAITITAAEKICDALRIGLAPLPPDPAPPAPKRKRKQS